MLQINKYNKHQSVTICVTAIDLPQISTISFGNDLHGNTGRHRNPISGARGSAESVQLRVSNYATSKNYTDTITFSKFLICKKVLHVIQIEEAVNLLRFARTRVPTMC